MGSIQFQHLRAFHAVADELSFTRAATRLHCAQSTVTAQIQQLERTLGAELFHRRGRCRIELTGAGLLLKSRAEAILAAVDTTQQDIRRLHGDAVPSRSTRPPGGHGPRALAGRPTTNPT
ncbi:LysR family transcriptional regulator [Streptacidiphilus albus]|uniref:LysR family transcriptional regulator n=1 Tax=Streptacidiphilus albus TaxID=105425 RepID=UPI001E47223F|nr:LysR family transcriptional regulator [Streptacidiphilus albus]